MKRVGSINGVSLFDMICDIDNVNQATKSACKDHAKDVSVIEIKKNAE